MGVLQGLDVSNGLDIILHTPGGDTAATESLIDYLNQKFDGDMRAIIPQLAMSAGTMIACACRQIIMGKQSSLGPIDPLINGIPAFGVLADFDRASKEMKKDKSKSSVWGPIIAIYPPSLINQCENAISWSKELALEYLSGSMFKEDLESNRSSTKKRWLESSHC